MKIYRISSGTAWEEVVGYSRAIRVGDIIEVSGTAAVDGDKVISPNNFYEQTRFILNKIDKALKDTGSGIEDVVRTRIYITDIAQWKEVGRAHMEFFSQIKPAATMVEVKSLIKEGLVVEIEATAVVRNKEN
ncbi:MAG: RidA family protein [Ignavibacteriaceae bacterium]|nr:RidA family protein [Ignavibacteriaceae bacterium]